MKKNILTAFAIFCGLLAGLTLLHVSVIAQSGTKTTAVVVTNTTANPVPVAGGVTVTNAPTVQLDQSANTVKIDPNSNVVQLAPQSEILIGHREPYTSLQKHDWIGQLLVSFPNINSGTTFAKARVCVTNQNANPASVTIMSWIFASDGSGWGVPIDSFELAAASSGCRLVDAPGPKVDIYVSSNNTAGQAWVGFWGIY